MRNNYKSKYTRYDPKYDKYLNNDYIADELKIQLNHTEDFKRKEKESKDEVDEEGDNKKDDDGEKDGEDGEDNEDGSKKDEEEDGDEENEEDGEGKGVTDSNFYPSL